MSTGTARALAQLPVVGQEPVRERADAARNRRKVLAAAERLFAERGVTRVSMDDVAVEAGVGKGTLYRRYPDQATLALALLGERERELQEAVLHGPAPLGPDGAPGDRLEAFLCALVDLLESHLDLYVMAERDGARFRTGLYAFYRVHVAIQLRAARPDLDADHLADALLAPLDAELYRHQRRQQHRSVQRIKQGLALQTRATLGAR